MFQLLSFAMLNEFQYPHHQGTPCPSDDVWDGAAPLGPPPPRLSPQSQDELFPNLIIKGIGEPGKLTATCA
eukprot:CAMPEP_0206232254 /NCGR_PEP_ID=MMETSP0047_2-20121206/11313_1 /ASSEMBLY_ACC=CAM_ASM_000192 /TAXON_ID=195065 /ORGANISM="Chroomonas mesostigmatica_cf, Strain CCMP1168" /LENGTH=70 /DNA_ID=CAMNT_0053655969 /DNA_START=177 /DNA_END=389 /DNA_ORIENTATION=+